MPPLNREKISIGQARDTGLAFVLILLLVVYAGKQYHLVLPAIGLLLVTMTWPSAFKSPARVWFGLSHLMGAVVSRCLLAVVFFGIVTPVGLFRRLSGADPMRCKHWKSGRQSAFAVRDHLFTAGDLDKPY